MCVFVCIYQVFDEAWNVSTRICVHLLFGIINLARLQNFPKNQYFLPLICTRMQEMLVFRKILRTYHHVE